MKLKYMPKCYLIVLTGLNRKKTDMLLGKCLLIKFMYNLFFNWKKKNKTENKMFTEVMSRKLIT